MLKNIKNWLVKNQITINITLYIYFFILTWLLLKPARENESLKLFSSVYNDKVVHTIAFFGLSLLGISVQKKNPILLVAIFTLYGILIELLQDYMKMGRTFEYMDILADFVGCLLGGIVARFLVLKNKKNT
jgi:VanZ family protein